MVSWYKKGAYHAQTSPKSELWGFKWADTHNKYVHDSMRLACLMWLHPVWYRIKIRWQINAVPTPAVAWTSA